MRAELKLAILSTVVTAVACFSAGEIWMRFSKPHMTPDTERAASLEYEVSLFARHVLPQKPQTTRSSDGTVQYDINALGYRGRSFAVPKPKGVIRIIVLGGSAAFDMNATEGQDWPHLVEEHLRQAGHDHVEVINAGTPGHATWDVLGRLYSEIWMLQPDYVLVYEEWNDIKDFGWLSPSRSLLRGFRPPPGQPTRDGVMVENPFIYYSGPVDRLLCHSQLYTRLRRRYWWWRLGQIGLEGLVTGPSESMGTEDKYPDTYEPWGPRQYQLNLRLIAAAARDVGATPIFLTQARLVTGSNDEGERKRIRFDYVKLSYEGLVRAFADCDRAIHDAAASEGVSVLDVSRALGGRSEFFTDHVHTSPAGSRAIAGTVGDFLVERLSGTSASPQ